jgi:hypothetical protein
MTSWRASLSLSLSHTHTQTQTHDAIKNSRAMDKWVLRAQGLSLSRVREVATSHKLGACVWRRKISHSRHDKHKELLIEQLIFLRVSYLQVCYLKCFWSGSRTLPLIWVCDMYRTWIRVADFLRVQQSLGYLWNSPLSVEPKILLPR